ncbi:MAG: YkgJ family cysteine cluster protein [Bacteroidetes bacterium]|nr:YkgJ family cysteine cluster protein [Bacteroidota bacterium]
MKVELEEQLAWSKKYRKKVHALFQRWSRKPPRDLDATFHQRHEEVFAEVDCLDCAHCCKTTSPIFKARDIDRISKSLRMKIGAFSAKYLKMDDEGDWVLQQAPCPFLHEDNSCNIYDVRPQACSEYPHTDRKQMSGILALTEENAHVCPAVSSMVQKILEAGVGKK